MQQNYSKKIEPIQKTSKNTASSVLDASSQSEALQRKADMVNNAAQREEAPRPNNTGMPDNLKSGIESLSGFSMDDVRVHYNSPKPATVQALAYTQGTDIHVAPGQEKHLPHEAWHVAQQMAGRVSPTTNINGLPVNDNAGLEHEADVMGEKAVQCKMQEKVLLQRPVSGLTAQCLRAMIINKEIKPPKNIIISDIIISGDLNALSNLKAFIERINDKKGKKKLNYVYKFGDVEFTYEQITTNILPFINESLDANPSIDANKVDISKLSGFTDLDSFKKCIKKELHKCIKKELHKCNLKSTVKIGTEFTFRGREADWPILPLSGLMSENEEELERYKKDIEKACPRYRSGIESFVKEMIIFALSKGKHVKETIHVSKCKNIDAHKLSFMSGLEELWWINVDVDDNCIELQTDAINYNEYSENYDFYNNLIFVSAKKAGLEPATDKKGGESGTVTQSGGGGHISLDSGSAFRGDVDVLHTFISEYTKKALQDVESNSGIFSYNDGVNSPLLKLNERRLENDFNNVFFKNSGDIAKYLEGLKDLYRSLKNEQLKELRDAGIVAYGDLTHYQAVNVDHFLGEGDKSRIEMRNFDAQINLDRLLNQVDALFDILADAYIAKEEQHRTELLPGSP